ncbi:DUF2779 domain-containing protein [bacterium]|nr:DUF2779 domain-containing protein [bacterium]
MKTNHLSKSDFKIACTCPSKLYYKKKGYPSSMQNNEYIELLAEGGYMVGKLAQLYYPEGIEVKTKKGTKYAIDETKELLKQDKVILFEPAIESNHKIIRVDVLIKDGKHFDLIEVKSKSYDSRKPDCFYTQAGGIDSKWRKYLEDVTYQHMVLKEAFPEADITPFLMMPDKAIDTDIEGLLNWFSLSCTGESETGFKSIEVNFTGDAQALRADAILTKVNVIHAVERLMPQVMAKTETYIDSLKEGLVKIQEPISKACKNCEYRLNVQANSGFHECWCELARVEPHILDLYYMGAIGGTKDPYVNRLIKQGKVCLFDMPKEQLSGKRGIRQEIQIKHTKENKEWIDPALKEIMQSWKYPLHFIDFETSTMALPYHKGMRPYETIAFQWSCHTFEKPGSEPIHREWINTKNAFPNFEFAETLMDTIGIKGSVFMWAYHENSTLKAIFDQLDKYDHDNQDLRNWIAIMAKFSKDEEYRMVNMDKLTLEHYFHPDMKGRTSLKVTLPAVWNNNPYLHEVPYFKKYVGYDKAGNILDPYKTLEAIAIAEESEVIKEGTGAMRAYQEMQYGLSSTDPTIKENWTKLLLQYCELDTMAMVIVYKHWCKLLGLT